MVVSMALLDMSMACLFLLSIGLTWTAKWWNFLAYLATPIPGIILAIYVSSIPLTLNWSRNLYSKVLWRGILFLIYAIALYASLYNSLGLVVSSGGQATFADAVYFSTITFSTVGYGDIIPAPQTRFVSSFQALLGLFTMPVIASLIWMYCQDRLRKKSLESQQLPDKFVITYDRVTGQYCEVDNDQTLEEQAERNSRFALIPCSNCSQLVAKVRKFYDPIGRLTPLARFMVVCDCGKFTKDFSTAYQAAYAWNNKKFRA